VYIENGLAYVGEPQPMIAVKSVRPLSGYRLYLRFMDDERKIFDMASMLEYPVFAPLKDKAKFDQAYVDYDCVVWENGEIDIAPEKLYYEGEPVEDSTGE